MGQGRLSSHLGVGLGDLLLEHLVVGEGAAVEQADGAGLGLDGGEVTCT